MLSLHNINTDSALAEHMLEDLPAYSAQSSYVKALEHLNNSEIHVNTQNPVPVNP